MNHKSNCYVTHVILFVFTSKFSFYDKNIVFLIFLYFFLKKIIIKFSFDDNK